MQPTKEDTQAITDLHKIFRAGLHKYSEINQVAISPVQVMIACHYLVQDVLTFVEAKEQARRRQSMVEAAEQGAKIAAAEQAEQNPGIGG